MKKIRLISVVLAAVCSGVIALFGDIAQEKAINDAIERKMNSDNTDKEETYDEEEES